jgi:hypothetical protein
MFLLLRLFFELSRFIKALVVVGLLLQISASRLRYKYINSQRNASGMEHV